MAKINNTAAYAISSPIDGSDIVIGSALGVGGDTKNFQMSDISAYVLGNSVTPTLDDVCQQGASTTTGITVAGTTTLNGALDANSTADIADTLTLSKASGNGLDVVADANIGGKLITNTIEADTGNLILNDSASIERLRLTAAGGFVFQGTVSFAQAAPSTSTSTGSTGQIALDTNYIYVCVGANSWGRIAIDTTPF